MRWVCRWNGPEIKNKNQNNNNNKQIKNIQLGSHRGQGVGHLKGNLHCGGKKYELKMQTNDQLSFGSHLKISAICFVAFDYKQNGAMRYDSMHWLSVKANDRQKPHRCIRRTISSPLKRQREKPQSLSTSLNCVCKQRPQTLQSK